MKKILILFIFLIFTFFGLFTSAKDTSAFDNDGIGANVSTPDDSNAGNAGKAGKEWNIDIGWDVNNGTSPYNPGNSFTFNFIAYWCSGYTSQACDGNNLDYRGVRKQTSFTVTLPQYGETTRVTANFDNLKTDYPCGMIQADVEHGGAVTGEIHNTTRNCSTQASLSCFGPPAKLLASWNIGYNDDPSCQIKITGGNTVYTLSDTKCNSSWDSSINPIPSGLSIRDEGIYQLTAGDTDGGTATCPRPAPACPTSGAGTTQTCGQTTYDSCVDNKNQSGSNLCKNGASNFRCYYSGDPDRCLSSSSASDFNYSCSACYVQIGGTITKSNGGGLQGVEVNKGVTNPPTCNIGTAITDNLGAYRFNNVYYETSFCLRPPSVTGYTGPNPTSSESQIATANKTDYNFTYTPQAPTQVTISCKAYASNGTPITTSNINQNITWKADITGGTPNFNYTWTGTDSLSSITSSSSSRTNSTTKTYTTAGSKSTTIAVTDSDSTNDPDPSKTCPNVTITAPDLQVDPLSPVTVDTNNAVSISATVTNYGDGTTGVSSFTRLKIDTNKDGTYDSLGTNGDKTTGILAEGGSASHTFSSVWTPAAAGTYNYQVCADATNTVNEGTNEGNNCKVNTITVNAPAVAGAPSTPTVTVPACTTAAYTATLSWTGTPLSSNDPTGCPNGFWVDIDNDSDWGNGYFHKCTTSTTAAPTGFGAYAGASGTLSLQPDLIYYARVYNGNLSGVRSFNSPTCTATFNYSLTNSGDITVNQGSSGANTITRTLISSTSSGVTLSASGLPSGASASLTNNPASPTSPSTLTISTLSTTPTGQSTITVTGSPLGKITTFILTVNPAGGVTAFNYSLTNSGNITVAAGQAGSNVIMAGFLSGSTQSVALSLPGLPTTTHQFQPNSSCSPTCTRGLSIQTTPSTPTGTYPLTVTGSPLGKTTAFTLTVNPAGGGSSPTVDLKANSSDGPLTITHNSTANLSWTTTQNPLTCTASGAWSGPKAPAGGAESTGSLSGPASYIYNLSCQNPAGSNADSVTVNVLPPGASPNPSPSPSPGPACGDLICTPPETATTCPTDCGPTPCGDGICSIPKGETAVTCPLDCPSGGGSNRPWIKTTGGDVHSNTGINTP